MSQTAFSWQWLLFLVSYELRLKRLHYPPLVINLEPTNLCNLRCPICPVSQNSSNPDVSRGFMTLELFEQILEKIKPFKPLVAINMGGESTLHPDLPHMIKRLHACGIYVFLDSNATVITEDLARQLLVSGLDELVLCIDGDGSADTYEQIRVGAKFSRTVANIRTLLSVRREYDLLNTRVVIKNIQYFQAGMPLQTAREIKQLFLDNPPDE